MSQLCIKVCLLYFFSLSFLVTSMSLYASTIKVGIEHWPPYSIINKDVLNYQVSGIDINIIKVLGDHLGSELILIRCPFKRCLRMIESGDLDMLSSLQKTPEREVYMHFLTPNYYTSNKVFYMLKRLNHSIETYNDLYKLSIGVTLGHHNAPKFDADTQLDKHNVSASHQLYKMLLNERFDTFIGVETSVDYFLQERNLKQQIEKGSFGFEGTKGYLAISKKSWLMKEEGKLASKLKDMINNGEVNTMTIDYINGTNRTRYKLE